MNFNFYIEFLSLISFFVFFVVNFIEIESNNKINKIIYLSNLLLISFINVIYYNFVILNPVSVLRLVTTLLIIIFFLSHFFISILSSEYLRLRLLFLPFFFIITYTQCYEVLNDTSLYQRASCSCRCKILRI